MQAPASPPGPADGPQTAPPLRRRRLARLVSARVTTFNELPDCVYFSIDVSLDGLPPFEVWRRFSHFDSLRKLLVETGHSNVPALPAKAGLGSPHTAAFLRDRSAALDGWLAALLRHPTARISGDLLAFVAAGSAMEPELAEANPCPQLWWVRREAERASLRRESTKLVELQRAVTKAWSSAAEAHEAVHRVMVELRVMRAEVQSAEDTHATASAYASEIAELLRGQLQLARAERDGALRRCRLAEAEAAGRGGETPRHAASAVGAPSTGLLASGAGRSDRRRSAAISRAREGGSAGSAAGGGHARRALFDGAEMLGAAAEAAAPESAAETTTGQRPLAPPSPAAASTFTPVRAPVRAAVDEADPGDGDLGDSDLAALLAVPHGSPARGLPTSAVGSAARGSDGRGAIDSPSLPLGTGGTPHPPPAPACALAPPPPGKRGAGLPHAALALAPSGQLGLTGSANGDGAGEAPADGSAPSRAERAASGPRAGLPPARDVWAAMSKLGTVAATAVVLVASLTPGLR